MRDNDAYAQRLVEFACELACTVRDDGPAAAAALLATLTPEDRATLPIVMAAMIPVELPPAVLLAWHTGTPTNRQGLQPCGTHAAYNRHKDRGEEPCDACVIGEQIYHRQRYMTTRRAA
ncbi:hypothetical protein [Nonomuraea sp. NPDC050202]|uniref:hypothetical protein n=1 Tax=Nonomuraea sp. NPDC050202 TaxID=3155035 RepID=UPI0033D5FC9B